MSGLVGVYKNGNWLLNKTKRESDLINQALSALEKAKALNKPVYRAFKGESSEDFKKRIKTLKKEKLMNRLR